MLFGFISEDLPQGKEMVHTTASSLSGTAFIFYGSVEVVFGRISHSAHLGEVCN